MIILSAKNITKEYGVDVILKDISFHINKGDKVGLIGANGAGKTTLLKILAREIEKTSGDFFISGDTKIGYLKQKYDMDSDHTIMEEIEAIFKPLIYMEEEMLKLSKLITEFSETEGQKELLEEYEKLTEKFRQEGGYTYRSEIKGILSSMAFLENQYDKPINTLSGGERTRLALAMLLLEKPDLLLLDEPTNHLDIGTLKWLEQYLKAYRGTVLLVSHDRYFLNQTTTKIFEIERTKLNIFEGNYSTYAIKKQAAREEEFRKYQSQQKEIEKQEEIIRRFKGHGTEKLAKRAASREKMLNRMEVIHRPEILDGKMKIAFKEKFKSGKDVLFAEDVKKSFGYGSNGKDLFDNVNLDIKKGERICIVGPNGIGKTTLMRIIMEDLEPSGGYIKKGHNVEIGYYDQNQQSLNEENTVIDEMRDSYGLYDDSELRSLLGRFLFKGDMVFLPIKALSGGEKARLSLLKLMLSGANLLILDEPTNHLDITSKEIFEDSLLNFPGTAIVISHDRYFLSKVPTKIMELERHGIETFLGKYEYYVAKKQEIESGKKYLKELKGNRNNDIEEKEDQGKTQEDNLSAAEKRILNKEKEAKERREKREKESLEQKIEQLEMEIAQIEEEMCKEDILLDYVKLAELEGNLQESKENLSNLYEKWLQYE